jgi:hypothetical protein
MPVFVEVQSHPAILDHDLNVLVVLVDVVSHFALMFLEDLHEEGNIVGRLVIDDVEVVLEWVV